MEDDEIGKYECINGSFQNLTTNLISNEIYEVQKIVNNLEIAHKNALNGIIDMGYPQNEELTMSFMNAGKDKINNLENSKKSIENANRCKF